MCLSKCRFHRFDLQVHAVGGIGRVGIDVQTLKNTQCDESSNTLTVGRDLVYRQPMEILLDTIGPESPVLSKILFGERTIEAGGVGHDP